MTWVLNRQSIERQGGTIVDPPVVTAFARWRKIGDRQTKVVMTVHTESLAHADRLFTAMVQGMNDAGVK